MRPVFVVFAGGGAKGLAHLGAATAATKEGLDFVGVAGSSAGAFVAALLAGGYRGQELFNPDSPSDNILTRHGLTPMDLLGTTKWNQSVDARRHAFGTLRTVLAVGAFLASVSSPSSRRLIQLCRAIGDARGHFDTRAVNDFVNARIREKLVGLLADEGRTESSLPARIRFRDVDYRSYPQLRQLKIIATDVRRRQPVVFSQETTPDVEVGDAVAASMAIPLVFRPVAIPGYEGTLFVDGGLVSNLPTWVFVEEKLAFERLFPEQPPVPTIAFTLVQNGSAAEAGEGTGGDGFLAYMADVAYAAVFGGQEIVQQFTDDLFIMPLGTNLTTMMFDASYIDVRTTVVAGRNDATRQIASQMRLVPERIRGELQALRAGFAERVNELRQRRGAAPLDRVRAALIVPHGCRSLRVIHSVGMETEADDRLSLARDGPGVARVFAEKDICHVSVERDESGMPVFQSPSQMTRYEAALMWPRMKSIVCIPIFDDGASWTAMSRADRPPCTAALSLDSDSDLRQDWTALRDWLVDRAIVFGGALKKES